MPTLREQILCVARSYLGVPWVHQGRTRKGVDCLGLPVCVARDLGWSPVDYTAYGTDRPDWPGLYRLVGESMSKVPNEEMDHGDVLLFECNHMPHVAIVGDKGAPWSLIHAHQGARRVVEAIYDAAWIERVRGVYRYKPVIEEEG